MKQGEFVCVIGDIGSGKSSLLSALIGDMWCMETAVIDELQNKDLDSEVLKEIKCDHIKR